MLPEASTAMPFAASVPLPPKVPTSATVPARSILLTKTSLALALPAAGDIGVPGGIRRNGGDMVGINVANISAEIGSGGEQGAREQEKGAGQTQRSSPDAATPV